MLSLQGWASAAVLFKSVTVKQCERQCERLQNNVKANVWFSDFGTEDMSGTCQGVLNWDAVILIPYIPWKRKQPLKDIDRT